MGSQPRHRSAKSLSWDRRQRDTSRERILSDAEVKMFWPLLEDNAGRALKILLLTGARPGEVARMRREHIKDGWWELPGKPDGHGWKGTKNGISHRVWLAPAVRELIGDGDGPVFRLGNAMRTTMQRLCRELNVPRCTPHDLRDLRKHRHSVGFSVMRWTGCSITPIRASAQSTTGMDTRPRTRKSGKRSRSICWR